MALLRLPAHRLNNAIADHAVQLHLDAVPVGQWDWASTIYPVRDGVICQGYGNWWSTHIQKVSVIEHIAELADQVGSNLYEFGSSGMPRWARWYAAGPIRMYVALLCMRLYIVPVRCIGCICMLTEGRSTVACHSLNNVLQLLRWLMLSSLSFLFSSPMTINGA